MIARAMLEMIFEFQFAIFWLRSLRVIFTVSLKSEATQLRNT